MQLSPTSVLPFRWKNIVKLFRQQSCYLNYSEKQAYESLNFALAR